MLFIDSVKMRGLFQLLLCLILENSWMLWYGLVFHMVKTIIERQMVQTHAGVRSSTSTIPNPSGSFLSAWRGSFPNLFNFSKSVSDSPSDLCTITLGGLADVRVTKIRSNKAVHSNIAIKGKTATVKWKQIHGF